MDSTATVSAEHSDSAVSTATWGKEHDDILVDWADKAMCYRWLHNRENEHYNRKNMWFTIPVIIISTVTGTANFAQEHFPNHRSTMAMAIGSFNIVAAIITTISQFLKVAEVNEAHRVAALSWDKFYRNVRLTLTKKPIERMPPDQQLKLVKEEFDRMMELAPPISQQVVLEFQNTFQHKEGYADIIKPDICGELRSTDKFRYTPCASKEVPSSVSAIEQFRRIHDRSPLPDELEDFASSELPTMTSQRPPADDVTIAVGSSSA